MFFNPELCRNESEVESKLIVQYLLPKLGYSPETWHQEVAFGSIRLDFLAFAVQVVPFVLDANSPLSILMEAKHPNQNLNNHVRKLKQYLTSLNVQYGLLTNGKEIRIYQKQQNDVQLIFQCFGREVDSKIDEIINLIGKDSLKNKYLPYTPAATVSQTNPNSAKQRRDMMKTIAIYHNKGGVGKTTVAVNLAAALSQRGKRVLLIDLDSQANTTFATGLIKFQFEEDDNIRECNVYHLLESGDSYISDIAQRSHYFNNPEIDVIPAHINLIEGQFKLNQIAASNTRLLTHLKRVEDKYDIVIIDTPPSRDLYARIALITADYLIIPSDLKPFANQGLLSVKNFIKEVDEFKEMIVKPPISLIGVLASKISTNSKFIQHTFPKQRSVITERYNLPLLETVIYDRTVLSECANQTTYVGELEYPDPKSVFKFADSKNLSSAQVSAGEFELLATEILEKMEVS